MYDTDSLINKAEAHVHVHECTMSQINKLSQPLPLLKSISLNYHDNSLLLTSLSLNPFSFLVPLDQDTTDVI